MTVPVIGSLLYDFSTSTGVTITNDSPMSLAIANNQLEGTQSGGGTGTNTAIARLAIAGFQYNEADYTFYWRIQHLFGPPAATNDEFGIRITYSDATVVEIYQTQSSSISLTIDIDGTPVTENDNIAANTWRWFKVTSVVSGSNRVFTVQINDDNSTTKPASFSNPVSGELTATFVNGKSTYITRWDFFHRETTGSPTGQILDVDDIEIDSDSTPFTDSTGGTLTTYESIEVSATLDGLGQGSIKINDSGLTNKATHLSNIRQALTITDAQGASRFKGEIKSVSLQRNTVYYQLRDYKAKLFKTITNTQTVLYKSFVRGIFNNSGGAGVELRDDNAEFGTDTYNTYLLTMIKKDKRRARYYAIDSNYVTEASTPPASWTPDDTAGDIYNLYFNDTSLSDANNRFSARSNSVDGDRGIELIFRVYANAINEIDEVRLYGTISWRSDSTESNFPYITQYNFTTTTYQAIVRGVNESAAVYVMNDPDNINDDYRDDAFGLQETAPVSFNATLDLTSDSYSASSNYFEFRLLFLTTENIVLDNTIHIHHAYLDVNYNTDQDPTQGRFYIDDTEDTRLVMTGAQSWENNTVFEDYNSGLDTYSISKNLDAVLVDIFANSAITLTLSENISDLANFGTTVEYQYQYIADFTEFLKKKFNAYDWIRYGSDTYQIQSVDNFSSSGVTLTRADIEGYDDGKFVHIINADKIVDSITVSGLDVLATVSFTPEYSNGLGSETWIEDNIEIDDPGEAIKVRDELRAKFDSADRIVRFTINITKAEQNYTNLLLGSTVAVQLPTTTDTSIMNYSSAGDGELVVYSWKFRQSEETGNQDLLDLELRRLYP